MQESIVAPEQIPIAEFVLDLGRQALVDSQMRIVELRPQAFRVLCLLALNAGRMVTKDELLAEVWPGVIVTDDSLVQAISDVRHALGEAGHQVVKTIPRRGYMLIGAAVSSPVSSTADVRPRAQSNLSPRQMARLLGAIVLIAVSAAGIWYYVFRSPDQFSSGIGSAPSIAVLAFKGAPSDPDGDALGRDVAADLVSELARSPDLRVVSNQSSFQFADGQIPLAEIGRRLRSRYLVDGTVRREGEQLRIIVELLDSQDSHVVWSSSTTVDRTTLAATQQALVSRIAGTLQSRVSRTEDRRALTQPPKTLDVFVLTAHGKSKMQQYSAQGMREARDFFEQALVIDPDYAPAWLFLGMTNTIDIGLRLTGEWSEARAPQVLAQIQHAISLQPDLPNAYVALSQAQGLFGNYEAALASAQQCLQLSPNDAGCFYALGSIQVRTGQEAAAVGNLQQALDRNPIPPAYLPAFYATALWADRRLNEAVRVTDDCLAKAPDLWRCRQDRVAALVELGRVPEAREEASRLLAQVPQMTARRFGLGFADSAATVRDRRIAAALAAGLPMDIDVSQVDKLHP